MAVDIALYREDTEEPLILEGCTSIMVDDSGRVTDYATESRSTIQGSTLHSPIMVGLEVAVAAERAQATRDFLALAKRQSISLALQRPGSSRLPLLVVESWTLREGMAAQSDVTISLKQVTLATTITVASSAIAPGPVRSDVRGAQEATTETGTATAQPVPQSLAFAAANEFVDFVSGVF